LLTTWQAQYRVFVDLCEQGLLLSFEGFVEYSII